MDFSEEYMEYYLLLTTNETAIYELILLFETDRTATYKNLTNYGVSAIFGNYGDNEMGTRIDSIGEYFAL